MSSSYSNKEISEWNSTDLSNWLLDNKYRGISELCQKYSLSGYDLFFITDDILKNELGLSSFHERSVTLKLINKLTSEHLKLNIINSNGDNVILTLDNNHETTLGEISKYIGNMFNIDANDILYKDITRQEVLSPTIKIINLMILYPRIYKTLNISNMKDYHQIDEKTTINKTDNNFYSFADNNNNTNNSDKKYQFNYKSNFDMQALNQIDNKKIINNNRFLREKENVGNFENGPNKYIKNNINDNEGRLKFEYEDNNNIFQNYQNPNDVNIRNEGYQNENIGIVDEVYTNNNNLQERYDETPQVKTYDDDLNDSNQNSNNY